MSILQTNRLILRPFKETDAEAMYKNWTYDARVAKYCRWYPHESIDTTRELLKMDLDAAAQGFAYQWAIVLNGTDEPIGAIDVVDEAVQEFTGRVIAIIRRLDDVEEKWVVAPDGMTFTKEEIMDAVRFQ